MLGKNSPTKKRYKSRGDLPSARTVSVTVHVMTSNMSREHSHLLMGYGQFLDHDITHTPEAAGDNINL